MVVLNTRSLDIWSCGLLTISSVDRRNDFSFLTNAAQQQTLLLQTMAPSSGNVYKDYFDNQTLSDLTLRIGDRQVHVHRIVLSSHSAYFEALLTSGFKVREIMELSS